MRKRGQLKCTQPEMRKLTYKAWLIKDGWRGTHICVKWKENVELRLRHMNIQTQGQCWAVITHFYYAQHQDVNNSGRNTLILLCTHIGERVPNHWLLVSHQSPTWIFCDRIYFYFQYTNDIQTNWIIRVMNVALTNVFVYCTASKRALLQ